MGRFSKFSVQLSFGFFLNLMVDSPSIPDEFLTSPGCLNLRCWVDKSHLSQAFIANQMQMFITILNVDHCSPLPFLFSDATIAAPSSRSTLR